MSTNRLSFRFRNDFGFIYLIPTVVIYKRVLEYGYRYNLCMQFNLFSLRLSLRLGFNSYMDEIGFE